MDNDAGASTIVRQELSHRAALLENKIVIWRFVQRDITYGAGMEQSGTADSSDAPI